MVILTVLVNGLAASSQTRSSSFSAETTLPWAASSTFQHAELLGAELQPPCAPGRDPAGGVQEQIAVDQDGGQRGPGPAGQRPDAGHQLGDVERLGQVVVGTQAQPLDPVFDGGRRRQHQQPAAGPVGYQLPADVVAVPAGQVAVEHDHVVTADGGLGERVAAVEGDVGGHALAAQHGRDRQGELGMILDHQHPHSSSPTAGAVTRPGPCARPGTAESPACPARDNNGVTALPPG